MTNNKPEKTKNKSGSDMGVLQVIEYFSENTPGEYATVTVTLPNKYLPKNLQEYEFGDFPTEQDLERMETLYVSPSGRLTKKMLCLNSTELAYAFCEYLIPVLDKRKYAKHYTIEVKVETSREKAKVNRWREKHSSEIENLLYGAG